MDWQNDEFETLLRRFRLREAQPLTPVQPAGIRRYRVKIAAAAAVIFAIGASAAIVRQRSVKNEAPAVVEVPPAAIETPAAVPTAMTAVPIPPVPQGKTPSIKLDPKAPEPLKQLTVVVPAPPQDAGPLSRQDSPPVPTPTDQPAKVLSGQIIAVPIIQKQGVPAEDQGRQIVNNACGLCHSPDLIGNSHFGTVDEYVAMVNRMVGMGAPLSPSQVATVADYLFKTYGPKPESAVDDRSKSVFNLACGTCHGTDLVDGRKDADKETYRSLVDRMIAYGAGVTPDQIDPLVEYLFRTYGRRPKK